MEHTVYLSAKAFIEVVGSCASKNKSTKDGTVPVEGEVHEDEEDIYDNEDWLADWSKLTDIPDEEEVDDVVDFTAGDVLGKILALVNQVFLHYIFLFWMLITRPDPCFTSG